MPSVSIIILAGGRSSRMGRDKATIEIDGVSLIRRIYDAGDRALNHSLNCDRASIYVVTPWIERYRSRLPPDCLFIHETRPHQGPLVGFSQGLSHINTDWVLLLACDLPYLSATAIESWLPGLADISPQSLAYLPKHPQKGWEPLCGFYRRNSLTLLQDYLQTGGRSFQGWLTGCQVAELIVTNPQWLFNCNTPNDLIPNNC